jgi:hypothetical protein
MQTVISNYSRRNCLTILRKLFWIVLLIVVFAGFTFYSAADVLVETPSKLGTFIIFCITFAIAIIRGGPTCVNLLVGAISPGKHIWLDGEFLYVGLPFDRRIRWRDIRSVSVGYAPGEIFGRTVTLISGTGRNLTFISDMADLDAFQIKEKISELVGLDTKSLG